MSEDVSLISMHPFFQKFILSVVTTMRDSTFENIEKVIVDSDLVPKFSDRVNISATGRTFASPLVERVVPPVEVERKDMSELVAPFDNQIGKMRPSMEIRQPVPVRPIILPPVQVQRVVPPPVRTAPILAPKMAPRHPAVVPVSAVDGALDKEEKYGKISPLLNDPSVSTIECPGKGKELMIIRAGQRHRTRVILNANEIRGILDVIADDAHIPLMEGVFRASVKGFSVSAVISEMIGSRFVIKKPNSYGLLE